MATTGPGVRPGGETGSEPTKKTPGNNVFEMKRQCQLQAHLGRNLQAVYQKLVKEPIPDTLNKLLDGLKRKENEK
jgi:Anti-sigma factor NepR